MSSHEYAVFKIGFQYGVKAMIYQARAFIGREQFIAGPKSFALPGRENDGGNVHRVQRAGPCSAMRKVCMISARIEIAISGGVLALLENPEQMALIREQPKRLRLAAEEIVRWSDPVISIMRTPTADTQIGGQAIKGLGLGQGFGQRGAMSQFSFDLKARDGKARTGVIHTPRGDIRTPAFMPVGTAATAVTVLSGSQLPPNMVKSGSRKSVFVSVMKNWLPLVLAPELA